MQRGCKICFYSTEDNLKDSYCFNVLSKNFLKKIEVIKACENFEKDYKKIRKKEMR